VTAKSPWQQSRWSSRLFISPCTTITDDGAHSQHGGYTSCHSRYARPEGKEIAAGHVELNPMELKSLAAFPILEHSRYTTVLRSHAVQSLHPSALCTSVWSNLCSCHREGLLVRVKSMFPRPDLLHDYLSII